MFELFSSSDEESSQIAKHLYEVGCCPRCTLRFLGETNSSAYKTSPQEIERALLRMTDEENRPVSPCPGCLGILQEFSEESFLKKIASKVKDDGYQFSDYQCSLILPVCLTVRQKAVFTSLCRKFSDVYAGNEDRISTVKDVWKWSCSYRLAQLLGAHFQNRSDFDILMKFTYDDSDKECLFLSDVFPDTFKKRKQRKFGFETFTRANVARALSQMDQAKFEDCSICPPSLPVKKCTCDIGCSHDAVFVAGRYQKYSRELSQTPWMVDGKRVMAGSVQELICQPILDAFKPTDHRLSSSGREDVDVRMLGEGRPFVVELINPHCVTFSKEDIAEVQQKINDSSKDVQVRDLQVVSREETSKLKEGEIDKTKSYSALCWCERDLTEEDLQLLVNLKDLVLYQKTPLRVLHRRTAATRERTIHNLKAEPRGDNMFKLYLTTQAGTYVKEFVHSDFGRTTPSLGELLKADCDILSLDVESVDVDWPPKIDRSSCEISQRFADQ